MQRATKQVPAIEGLEALIGSCGDYESAVFDLVRRVRSERELADTLHEWAESLTATNSDWRCYRVAQKLLGHDLYWQSSRIEASTPPGSAERSEDSKEG